MNNSTIYIEETSDGNVFVVEDDGQQEARCDALCSQEVDEPFFAL